MATIVGLKDDMPDSPAALVMPDFAAAEACRAAIERPAKARHRNGLGALPANPPRRATERPAQGRGFGDLQDARPHRDRIRQGLADAD